MPQNLHTRFSDQYIGAICASRRSPKSSSLSPQHSCIDVFSLLLFLQPYQDLMLRVIGFFDISDALFPPQFCTKFDIIRSIWVNHTLFHRSVPVHPILCDPDAGSRRYPVGVLCVPLMLDMFTFSTLLNEVETKQRLRLDPLDYRQFCRFCIDS
ncbi:hypothetical protein I7I48_04276 [Histoplasma ohiense]|nr:hypothetical protein I7I48_04276 [Histoplasma ohiense (nom. inval.)]